LDSGRGGGRGGGADRFNSSEDSAPRAEPYRPEEEEADKLFDHGISSGINFNKYDNIKCEVSGENAPNKITSFDDSGLREILRRNVKKCNYSMPTPVQQHAIPIIMGGRDLMATAQTGSGKTAAFLLPILHKLLEADIESKAGAEVQAPEVVVIAPTRELAIQIKDESRKFAAGSCVNSVVLYGGTSVGYQKDVLRRGVNILIATPGRLLHFVEEGIVSFSSVKFLVLDEADRMLDMGFMPDIQRMVRDPSMPNKGKRQTLMFSATFPSDVQQVAAEFLDNYLFLMVGIVGGACSDVQQNFYEVSWETS
jgi:probable ATP-dependent RNA helicase DDX4